MTTISSRTSFWIVAWVLTISLWSSTAPSIEFPVYALQWHLSKAVTTGIFSIYPIVLILVLFLLGNISDYIGRRNTLITGLIFLLIGAVVFATAQNVIWLFVGRVLQGFGVGLTAGSGAAALVEYNPYSNKKLPGSINTITQAVGLFLATIVGATLIKYAPSPLYFSYWVLAVLVLVSIVLCLFLPKKTAAQSTGKPAFKLQGVKVPKGLWRVYLLAALAIGTGFANGAVLLSLGAQIARDVIGTQDILVIGTVLSISYLLASVSAIIAGRLKPVTSIRIGMASIAVAMVLLISAAASHSFLLFMSSSILGGLAYGFSASGAIGLAAINSPVQNRVQFLSAVLVAAYLFQGSSAYGGGVASSTLGFSPAIWLMAVIIGILALGTLLFTIRKTSEAEAIPAKPAKV
ncbi:Predicted arabinose efflux permease, MFS family [Paenibacillus catalpae]|uniref:Predicted arabinose efflux permease, MFS family n=1 Tax=Paenibacillus catalpae TaxID=1045775 RepID=A0A1I1V373_9BACL|nr:MFS transporter [Paenibacillus catalpae]SFD76458.1 Predicted arabinose efflux permease, MFS family [Paenibacillus catalpae]